MSKIDPDSDFQDLLDHLGIDQWDLLLVGDGSGNTWDYACGWACVAIEKQSMDRQVLSGSMNRGTNNVAELMAYVHALTWYVARVRNDTGDIDPRTVHVLTDSEYVAKTGQAGYPALRRKNKMLWTAVEMAQRQAIYLRWHHLDRATTALNRYADYIAGEARKAAIEPSTIEDPSQYNPE